MNAPWDPKSTLIHGLLTIPKWSIVCADIQLPAVVAREDDDRISLGAASGHRVQDVADTGIHVLNQRNEFCSCFGNVWVPFLNLAEPFLWRLDRCVGSVVGEVQEPWLFTVLFVLLSDPICRPL